MIDFSHGITAPMLPADFGGSVRYAARQKFIADDYRAS